TRLVSDWSSDVCSSDLLDSRRSTPVVAAFPTAVSRPILDGNTGSVSAKPITVGIAASNTAATGSDSLTRGQATGSTRKTFLSSRLTACITFATRCIRASTLHSASHHSGPSGVAWGATSLTAIGAGPLLGLAPLSFRRQQGHLGKNLLADSMGTFTKSEL